MPNFYDGTEYLDTVTNVKVGQGVVYKGTALPVGAANFVPQNGFFCLVDSLSAPTTATWYIQTSATISSPTFTELPAGVDSELPYLLLSTTIGDYTSPNAAVVSSGGVVADITDDFTSYADQAAADAVYPSTDTAKARVNVSTDLINYQGVLDSSNDSLSRDLTSMSDTAWAARFHLIVTGLSTTGGDEVFINIGFSSADHNTIRTAVQDSISLNLYCDNLNRPYRIQHGDGASMGANSVAFTETVTNGDNYYIELKRTSATNVDCNIYSDSSFTTLVETKSATVASTITGLRYFVMKNNSAVTASGSITITLDDLTINKTSSTFTDSSTYLYDNNTGTTWTSSSEANPRFYVDLTGAVREIVGIALNINKTTTTITSIKIRASTDTTFTDAENIAYINLTAFTDDTWRFIANNFIPENKRYVQVYSNETGVLSVNEIKVRYGVTDAVKILGHRHRNRTVTSADSFVDSN